MNKNEISFHWSWELGRMNIILSLTQPPWRLQKNQVHRRKRGHRRPMFLLLKWKEKTSTAMQNKSAGSKCSLGANPSVTRKGRLFRPLRSRKAKTRRSRGGCSPIDAGLVRFQLWLVCYPSMLTLGILSREYESNLSNGFGSLPDKPFWQKRWPVFSAPAPQ